MPNPHRLFTRHDVLICKRKARYRTRADASTQAALRTLASGVHVTSYECPVCGRWHLTHRPEGEEADAKNNPHQTRNRA
jgi:hypothetical protein